MDDKEVVKACHQLLEALRSGRVGIVWDERVNLLVEGRGLQGRVGSVEKASRFLWSGWCRLLSSWWLTLVKWPES
jgi:hypothetical protein